MVLVEDMSNENCHSEKIIREIHDLKALIQQNNELLRAVLQANVETPAPKKRKQVTKKERQQKLAMGRRVLITCSGLHSIPSLPDLAGEIGVAVSTMYNAEWLQPLRNERENLIAGYTAYKKGDITEGFRQLSDDGQHTVDGIHEDEISDDF